jgi:transcriptional regulator with GAF, ATPase, and Fis domain
VTTRHYDRQSAAIATISGNLIKSLEQSQVINRRRWVQLCTLHTFAEAILKGYTTPTLLVNHCPGHLFEDIMQTLRTVFGAAAVSIALHDRNGGYATVAVEGDGSNGHQTLYPGEGASGQAINQGRAILVPDTRQQREQDTLLPAAASLIAAPIIGRRDKYGVIAVGGAEANQWNEEDTRTVQTLARMLAAVIEQNMELNQSQTQADAYTRNLEQAVQRLRQPVGYLLSLTQQLRDAGTLNSAQQETLSQFELLTGSLARVLGVSATDTMTMVEEPEAERQPMYERALGE